jgi:5-dehydro-2-deoxygluconokinase
VVLGLAAPEEHLRASFAAAARLPLVKGFAVGRTIFGEALGAWLAGTMDDDAAISDMARRYRSLCAIWDRAAGLKT